MRRGRTVFGEDGSTLVVCLITAALLGLTLASYLDLVGAQNMSTMRSQAWNATVPVLEAGVEEALTHLYHTRGTNLTGNGWLLADNQYYRWRELGDARVLIVISNVSPPVVYAHGYVRTPLDRSNWVVRAARVTTRADHIFTHGLVAKGEVTLNGSTIMVDSFDSADPTYSTNGLYSSAKRKDNGHVATNASLTNALDSGNVKIYGRIATGPNGTVKIGAQGKVGSLDWHAGSTNGIQPGYSSDDMNVSFPDVVIPFAVGSPVPATPGYQYDIALSGNYQVSAISGSVLVRSNVNAVLVVEGNIDLTGTSKFQIEPGGSLHLYAKGPSTRIAGNGVVNQNGNATSFFYWGLPSNKSVTISGNGSFTGVIYAPEASFVMNGGGSGEEVTGAVIAGSVRMNGSVGFHYDENLGRLNYLRGFIVTGWNEI